MKKIMKKLFPVALVLSLVFIMAGCGKEKASVDYNEDTVDKVTQNVIALMSQSVNPGMADSIAKADEDELQSLEEEIASMGLGIKGAAFQSGYASYLSAVEGDLGEIVDVADKAVITADEEVITSDITVTGTKTFPDGSPRTATVEMLMNKHLTVTSVTFNVDRTFGEKIENAGLNTILGMGTTFCLLIFISIVIWLMGTIVQGVERKKTQAKTEKMTAADKVAEQIAAREEQAVSTAGQNDDAALIAVITAAIAAYESETTGAALTPDMFVVRSLRRR